MTSENTSHGNSISNQIFYKQVTEFAPRYKYVRINMSNILGNVVTLNPTSSIQVQFKLPYNTVYNLSKSKLVSLIPVPLQTTTANTTSYLASDCWPFGNQVVSFETGNGLQLLNLPEASRYTKVVTKVNTKLVDFLCSDVSAFPHPKNDVIANNPLGVGTAGVSTSYANTNYLESEYFIQSGPGLAINIPISYELKNFSNTILSLDKDVYYGQNDMYFKFTIDGYNKFLFQSSNINIPATTPATLSVPIATTAGNGLQNVYLYLAVETNPVIIDSIVSQFNTSGLKLLIDYPFVTRTTAPATSSQNIVIPFVPAQGKFLKRIYHTVWNNADSLNLTFDNVNKATFQKIIGYNTYLDSTKLQDDVVTSAVATSGTNINQDDWRINEPFCRNSIIQNYGMYQNNWFHIDDFCNPDMQKEPNVTTAQNTISGLPMERGVQWQFTSTSAGNALIHDNFAIFSRNVHISPSGVQFI